MFGGAAARLHVEMPVVGFVDLREKGRRWPALFTADCYFLAFFLAFFFFAISTSFSPNIGKSDICLEPIAGNSSFLLSRGRISKSWLMLASIYRPAGTTPTARAAM
jgi:hypothetical protein